MTHLAGSSKLLRTMNSQAALALLLERGRLTRAELREATGLSKPTVSEAMRRLVEADLAVVAGHVRGGPGPNAELYAVNADAAYGVAVSIGASVSTPASPARATVRTALCDLAGVVRAARTDEVDLRAVGPVDVVAAALDGVGAAAGVDRARILHVQLGVAGAYDRASRTVHHVDLPGFEVPGLVTRVAERLGTAVDVDNDVNLAALAERGHGCAAGTEGFALLWLGDGLGLAIDLDGQLLRGVRGGAGEIGYLPLFAAGAPDAVTPDLQDILGGAAVRELAGEHGHRGASAAQAVAAGIEDPDFVAALASRVVVALGVVVSVLDPALVVLAGPVGRAGGEALCRAAAARLDATALPRTRVATTAVPDDPVVRGGLDAAMSAVHARLHARVEN